MIFEAICIKMNLCNVYRDVVLQLSMRISKVKNLPQSSIFFTNLQNRKKDRTMWASLRREFNNFDTTMENQVHIEDDGLSNILIPGHLGLSRLNTALWIGLI